MNDMTEVHDWRRSKATVSPPDTISERAFESRSRA